MEAYYAERLLQELKSRYEEVKYNIGKLEYLDNILSSSEEFDISKKDGLLTILISDQENFSDNSIVKYNSYQKLIDLINEQDNSNQIHYIENYAHYDTSKVTGLIDYSKISSITIEQVLDYNPVYYASDVEGKLEYSQVEYIYSSQILNYDATIAASKILGKFDSNQINKVEVSQFVNKFTSNEINYIYLNQINDLSSIIEASLIEGEFPSSIFDSTVLQSYMGSASDVLDFSFPFGARTDSPGTLWACNNIGINAQSNKKIAGSTDPSEMMKAINLCIIFANSMGTKDYSMTFSNNYYHITTTTSLNMALSSDLISCYNVPKIGAAGVPLDFLADCLATISGNSPDNSIFANYT